ncbi:uncharacterized protein LOC101030820 [Saimiri boliviensis]|uniref:uncharacterized protein LOC101030820 n=1 Tax=Saimiri boliviensis TaxID=27679 RepID=UPI003D787D52
MHHLCIPSLSAAPCRREAFHAPVTQDRVRRRGRFGGACPTGARLRRRSRRTRRDPSALKQPASPRPALARRRVGCARLGAGSLRRSASRTERAAARWELQRVEAALRPGQCIQDPEQPGAWPLPPRALPWLSWLLLRLPGCWHAGYQQCTGVSGCALGHAHVPISWEAGPSAPVAAFLEETGLFPPLLTPRAVAGVGSPASSPWCLPLSMGCFLPVLMSPQLEEETLKGAQSFAVFLIHTERKKGVQSSAVLFGYWLLCFVLPAASAAQQASGGGFQSDPVCHLSTYLCLSLVVAQFVLSCLADQPSF